jgi:hypothetical protein
LNPEFRNLVERKYVMAKSGAKISASEILRDIGAGMSDAQLRAKYHLSERGLESVYRKLHQAGLLPRSEGDAPITADKALVPLQKVSTDLVRYEQGGLGTTRGTGEEWRENEKLSSLVESTTHLWLLLPGIFVTAVGVTLYLLWPYLQPIWLDDLELARLLGRSTQAQRTYDLWFQLCNQGGPFAAIVGSIVSVVGLFAWWLKGFRVARMMGKKRYGIWPSSAKSRTR